jgi:DNA (cytosine-5)-methyltransferase 1
VTLVFGSVCSGIEAASVAWHPLGWRAAFVSDIEAFPRAVLRHRWPGTPLHGRDRRKGESVEAGAAEAGFQTIQKGDYEPIDLLVGGTPCQSFSVAGLRGGLGDGRGNLALEYLRLADRLRPRWLVWENVPGVLSSNGGRDFGAILGGMVELGYGVAYRVLDAQFFGVAQRRRRVFVVGYLGDWRRAAAVLFERHGLSGAAPPLRGRVFNCFDTGVASLDRSSKDNLLWTSSGFRVATPLEVERCFGFPDHYTNVAFKGRPATDARRYHTLGNSMAVPVMAWIGRRIEAVEALAADGLSEAAA